MRAKLINENINENIFNDFKNKWNNTKKLANDIITSKIETEKTNNNAIETILNYIIIPYNYIDIILNRNQKYLEIIKDIKNDDENIIIRYEKGYMTLGSKSGVINIGSKIAGDLVKKIMLIHNKNLAKNIENKQREIKNGKNNIFLDSQIN